MPLSIKQFPLELADAVVKSITDKKDLLSLCLVDKTFSDLAQRCLYRQLQFILPTTAAKICQAMRRRPALATYVRSLEVAVMSRALERNDAGALYNRYYYPFETALWRLLAPTLRLMTGLKRLILVGQWAGAPQLLLPCPFELETLHLNTCEQLPIDILLRQQHLKEFVFWSTADPTPPVLQAIQENKEKLLPRARHLGGRFQILKPLLPGHTLDSADFLIGPPFKKDDVSALMRTTGETSDGMTYVHLCLKTLAQLDIGVLAASFPNAVTLYIHIYGGEASDCFFLEWLAQPKTMAAFREFQALSSLKMSHAQFQDFQDPDAFRTTLDELADACPTLKSLEAVAAHIDYLHSHRTLVKDSYTRIKPGASMPRPKSIYGEVYVGAQPGEAWLVDHEAVQKPISAAWSAAYPLELSEM